MPRMRAESMRTSSFFQSGGTHPYEHKLRLRPVAPSPFYRGPGLDRSLTVSNFQIAPRTTFEMERPVTHGSPRLVVINTSFRAAYHDRNTPRKRVPTFPELATDAAVKRTTNVSRQTNSTLTSTGRMQSGNSTYRRDVGSASKSLGISGIDREESANSGGQAGHRSFLTARQSNTFAAYAKYNDIVNATKAREKALESPITSNKNDLSALVPEKMTHSPDLLSSEKHMWISDWVASTSAALRLDDAVKDDGVVSKPLSVIQEN